MEMEKLCSIVAEVLKIEADSITEDTAFVEDLGADSLDVFQIMMQVEETFDIEISSETADGLVTIGEAVHEIRKAVG